LSGEASIIIKIKNYIRYEYSVSKVGVVMDQWGRRGVRWGGVVHNHTHFTYRIFVPDILHILDYNTILILTIVNGYATKEISLPILHCIISSEAQFET